MLLAAEHPTDQELDQNPLYRKNRVVRFAARETAHGLSKLDFFKISQKDFNASETGCVSQ